jgi:hypothetical protein
MKKHYQEVLEPLSRLSGVPWTPENGVNFAEDTPVDVRGVWHTYVAV